MRFVMFFLLLGCDSYLQTYNTNAPRTVVCSLSDFENFPKQVSGPVTLELKNYITILVYNKDNSEKIEITFPKEKCRVK